MRLPWRSDQPAAEALVSVVVPAYGVEAYLPACLDSLLAQTWRTWEAIVVDDGSPDRCGEIAEAYAARDDADPGRARDQRRTRVGPQRRGRACDRRVPHVPRLRRRAAAGRAVGARRHAARVGLRLRHRLDRALGGALRRRQPARAAVDEAAALARPGAADRGPAGDPRRRLRLEQGLHALLLGRQPTSPGRRASATRTSRRPPGRSWPAPSTSWTTSSTTGASATTAPRSPSSAHRSATSRTDSRPSGCRTRRSTGRGRGRRVRVRRPGAGRRPVALLPGDPPRVGRVVGVAPRRGAGVLGAAVAGAQRTAARAPAVRLAGRAGPASGGRVPDGVVRDPAPARHHRSATARADTSTYRARCSICRRSTRPRSRCGTTRSLTPPVSTPGAPAQPAARLRAGRPR